MKKTLLIITAFLFITSTAFPQAKMDMNNLMDRGGLLYAPNKEKPFSGSVFALYDNGQKKLNGRYRNGIKNGKWTWLNEDGGLDSTGSYKNGLMHGQWEFYFSNGKLKGKGQYRDGNGTDRGNTGIPRHGRHRKWTFWYESGFKSAEQNWKNGKAHGLYIEWNENGQKISESNSKNGFLEGIWTAWYENGQKRWEGTFKDGLLDGLVTSWLQGGKESFEVIYKDGNPWDGLELWWYSSSRLKASVKTYKDGELISTECWDEDGNEKDCN